MKIVAVTTEGREFMYKSRTAHKVSERSAARIAEALNNAGFQVDKANGEKWHVYNIDEYSAAYPAAIGKQFTIRNGYLYEKKTA